MPIVISTKKLSNSQKKLFHSKGFIVKDFDFIGVKQKSFTWHTTAHFSIFTSKNAVKSVREHPDFEQIKKRKVFCVGANTQKMLENFGFEVVQSATYVTELFEIIQKKFSNFSFEFFCGNLRSNVLIEGCMAQKIRLFETWVYCTELTSVKIENNFDAVLFFSPSGVKSFILKNKIDKQPIFCIGKTTAKAVEIFSENYHIASTTTTNAVLYECINYFNSDKNVKK